MSVSERDFRQQFLQQRGEFEFGEELAEEIEIGIAGVHGFDVEIDGNVSVDGGHALAEENDVAIVLEGFAVCFLLNFGGAIERLLDGAEAFDNFDRAFVADAGRSGDIVDSVAAQCHDIDHALGKDSENFFDLGSVADEIVFGGIQDENIVVDELHHVLVAGNYEDGMRCGRGFAGESADDIVGLEAGEFEDGDAVGLEGAADVGNLLGKILGHGGAVGFVSLVFDLGEGLGLDVELADGSDGFGLLVAEGGGGDVEDSGEVRGREIVAQFAQHVDEDEDGGGGKSGFGGHGALPRHGMISAEDEAHGVDEEDAAFAVFAGRARDCGRCGGCAARTRFRRFCSRGQGSSLAAGTTTGVR